MWAVRATSKRRVSCSHRLRAPRCVLRLRIRALESTDCARPLSAPLALPTHRGLLTPSARCTRRIVAPPRPRIPRAPRLINLPGCCRHHPVPHAPHSVLIDRQLTVGVPCALDLAPLLSVPIVATPRARARRNHPIARPPLLTYEASDLLHDATRPLPFRRPHLTQARA